MRHLLAHVLGSRGCTVLQASNGPEALEVEKAHQEPIHLLLTDVVMPKMDGRELSRRFRRVRPDARVVYMSGNTGTRALEGFDFDGPLIRKPFDLEVLFRTVSKALRKEGEGEAQDGDADT